eukprot:7386002-Prymnesium_polylepis.2
MASAHGVAGGSLGHLQRPHGDARGPSHAPKALCSDAVLTLRAACALQRMARREFVMGDGRRDLRFGVLFLAP